MTKDFNNFIFSGEEIFDMKKREALLNEVDELTEQIAEWETFFIAVALCLYLKIKDYTQTDMSPKNSQLFQSVIKTKSPEDFHALCARWIHKLEPIKKTKGAK